MCVLDGWWVDGWTIINNLFKGVKKGTLLLSITEWGEQLEILGEIPEKSYMQASESFYGHLLRWAQYCVY